MAALVAAIHVFNGGKKKWITGTRPAMTECVILGEQSEGRGSIALRMRVDSLSRR